MVQAFPAKWRMKALVLGTFQIAREKLHSSHIVKHLTLTDPQVLSCVQGSSARYASARMTQGIRSLAAAATHAVMHQGL